MRPAGILETAVYAEDLDAAERFYAGVIGLECFARERGRHVFFRCGAGMFLVFNPKITCDPSHTPGGILLTAHGAHGPGHMAFAIGDGEVRP